MEEARFAESGAPPSLPALGKRKWLEWYYARQRGPVFKCAGDATYLVEREVQAGQKETVLQTYAPFLVLSWEDEKLRAECTAHGCSRNLKRTPIVLFAPGKAFNMHNFVEHMTRLHPELCTQTHAAAFWDKEDKKGGELRSVNLREKWVLKCKWGRWCPRQ